MMSVSQNHKLPFHNNYHGGRGDGNMYDGGGVGQYNGGPGMQLPAQKGGGGQNWESICTVACILRVCCIFLMLCGGACTGYGVFFSYEAGVVSLLSGSILASGASVFILATFLYFNWYKNKVLVFCYMILISFVIIGQIALVVCCINPPTRTFMVEMAGAATDVDLRLLVETHIDFAVGVLVGLILLELVSWVLAYLRHRQLSKYVAYDDYGGVGGSSAERTPLKMTAGPSPPTQGAKYQQYEQAGPPHPSGGYSSSAWPTATEDDDTDAYTTRTEMSGMSAMSAEESGDESLSLRPTPQDRVRARYEKYYKKYNIQDDSSWAAAGASGPQPN